MRRELIERIVDGLDVSFGPGADVRQIEIEAERLLNDLSAHPLAGKPSTTEYRPTFAASSAVSVCPLIADVPVHIRIDDCTGRLPATVVSHSYDKIRRLASGIPARLAQSIAAQSYSRPLFILYVHGSEGLIRSFSPSNAVEICQSIEQSAVDCGFDRIELLGLHAGKGGSAVAVIPFLPDILRTCTHSWVEIEVGSSAVGLRANEVLSAARLIRELPAEVHPRMSFSVNSLRSRGIFRRQTSDIRVDLRVSIWPALDSLRDSFSDDICYGDRFELLRSAGIQSWGAGTNLLDQLTATGFSNIPYDGKGCVYLTIDHAQGGLERLEPFTGLSATAPATGIAGGPAALLRHGLLGGIPRAEQTDVFSDGLPVTDALRQVAAFDSHVSAPRLAGHFVDTFTSAVLGQYSKSIKLIGTAGTSERSTTGAHDFPGIVPVLDSGDRWSTHDFERGGALVPPVSSRDTQ